MQTSGLKGQNSTAQGNALGVGPRNAVALKGRNKGAVPDHTVSRHLPVRGLRCRDFLALAVLSPTLFNFYGMGAAAAENLESLGRASILFTSQGKAGIVDADGSRLRYFDFQVPGQATWQPGPSFPDGKRLVFLSMEPRRDGPGRPFDEYYTQTPTHLWVHDLESGALDEICAKDRLAPFVTPALLLGDDRIL